VLFGIQPNIVISHTQVTTDALVANISQDSTTVALLKVHQSEMPSSTPL
jgi:hypothetical protein